jgi:hypothetical protein
LQTSYTVQGVDAPITFDFLLSAGVFVTLTVIQGFMMRLGKAAVWAVFPAHCLRRAAGPDGCLDRACHAAFCAGRGDDRPDAWRHPRNGTPPAPRAGRGKIPFRHAGQAR